jgi:hypothetical protein
MAAVTTRAATPVRTIAQWDNEYGMDVRELVNHLEEFVANEPSAQIEITIGNGIRQPVRNLTVKSNGRFTWIELTDE